MGACFRAGARLGFNDESVISQRRHTNCLLSTSLTLQANNLTMIRNFGFWRRAADLWEIDVQPRRGASRGEAEKTGRQHMLVGFPGDLDERRDFVKFTQLYKTGQNGKGDHRIV